MFYNPDFLELGLMLRSLTFAIILFTSAAWVWEHPSPRSHVTLILVGSCCLGGLLNLYITANWIYLFLVTDKAII